MTDALPYCQQCGAPLTSRGGLTPRFCPRCGRPVAGDNAAETVEPAIRQRVAGTSVAALVVGLVGLVTPCGLVGLVAILLGTLARSSIRESSGRLSGNGLATAGIVLGIIGSAIWVAFCAASL